MIPADHHVQTSLAKAIREMRMRKNGGNISLF